MIPKSGMMGRDDFIWWLGVVESRKDPLMLGRCKVRILGWHPKSKIGQDSLATEDLPWAYPMQPITSAAQTQVGQTPLGVVEGTWVIGFFQDGEEAQYPVMMGSLGGWPETPNDPTIGFNDPRPAIVKPRWTTDSAGRAIENDKEVKLKWPRPPYNVTLNPTSSPTIVEYGDFNAKPRSGYPDIDFLYEPTTHRLARGLKDRSAKIKASETNSGESLVQWKFDNLVKDVVKPKPVKFADTPVGRVPIGHQQKWSEPGTPYATEYPYNHVTASESGHIFEVDDTPGAERLNWHHRSGTFTEIHPRGTKVEKTVSNCYEIVYQNSYKKVYGHNLQNIDGSYELFVNQSKASFNDYYTKVGGRGNEVHILDGGSFQISSNSGTFQTTSRGVSIKADEEILLEANKITLTYGESDTKINGTSNTKVDGEYNVSASNLELKGDNRLILNGARTTADVAVESHEKIRATPAATTQGGSADAKLIQTVFGQITLNSINATKTFTNDDGGINLNYGPILPGTGMGAGANIIMDGLGDVKINSILGTTGVDIIVGKGDMYSTVTAGDVVYTLPKGSFDVTTLLGDVVFSSTSGKFEGSFGKSFELTTKGTGKVEAKGTLDMVGSAVTLDAKTINFVKNSKEAFILGNKFIEKFVEHQHATGTGPSGPVMDASPYTNHLSKKIFGS